jgi:hypothetical protein
MRQQYGALQHTHDDTVRQLGDATDGLHRMRRERDEGRHEIARQAGLVSDAQARIATLDAQLAAARQDVLGVRRDLAAERERVGRLTQELEGLRRELAEGRERVAQLMRESLGLHRDLGEARERATGLAREAAETRRTLEAIESSRSWRLTLPLRLLAGFARRILASSAAPGASAPTSARRPLKQRLMARAVAYVRSDPERKLRVVRVLRRFRPLDRRLRAMVDRHVVQPAEHEAAVEIVRERPLEATPRPAAHASAAQRDASRRMHYLIELENRLDALEARHRAETARLTSELAQARGAATKSPQRA